MAKTIAPLFGFSASGKLANALVFSTWKGIKTVRQYVIPANPNTAGQQAQRGYMGAAVTDWQTAGLDAVDKVAWNVKAGAGSEPRSGFNQFCSEYIGAAVAGNDWDTVYAVLGSDEEDDNFDIVGTGVTGHTYVVKYGTSKTALTASEDVVNTAGALACTLTSLAASTRYFWKIVDTTADNDTETGIYQNDTLAS